MSENEKRRPSGRAAERGTQGKRRQARPGERPRDASFIEPSRGNETPDGAPTKATQGYGTAQGASGATSGGADAGGSLHVLPPRDGRPSAAEGAGRRKG